MNFPVGPNTNLNLNGKNAGLTHQFSLMNTPQHNLTGTASVAQHLSKGGATTVGATAAYTHGSGSGINAGIQHTKGAGNVGTVGANVNVAPGVDAYAQCQKSRFGKNCTVGIRMDKKF